MLNEIFQQIVLGSIQGITEWIPVSSKACVMAAKVHLFNSHDSLNQLIDYALFLHLGTFFAAAVYFWKDVRLLLVALPAPHKAEEETRKLLLFLVLTTILTALGQLLINSVEQLAYSAPKAKTIITGVIASLLVVAGILQVRTRTAGKRSTKDITLIDGILMGLVQAAATLPGLSRAGTTMAALSARGFDKENVLKISFLMSMPVILVGNIIKNYRSFLNLNIEWFGVLAAFIVGFASIGVMMAFARRVNFGVFLIVIGSILMIATSLGILD